MIVYSSPSRQGESPGGSSEPLQGGRWSLSVLLQRDQAPREFLVVVVQLESTLSDSTNLSQPANAQTAAKPYIEGLQEGANHIREELVKRTSSPPISPPHLHRTNDDDDTLADVPFSTKANNVLTYTKDKLSPILVSIRDVVVKGKVELEKDVASAEASVETAADSVASKAPKA